MRYALPVIGTLLLICLTTLFGCGETEETTLTPMDDGAVFGTMGAMKVPEGAPAAPQMPEVGIPRVTDVGFYHDWKLTKAVTSPVKPGERVFIKVAFSEPMKHVVSEGKEARPIIYHKVDKEQQIHFKMAAHGARGEDFVSGDAKPLHGGTDDYICKLIVPDEAEEVAIHIGKWSIDLQGNPLAKFYRHPVKLQVKHLAPPAETKEIEPEIPGLHDPTSEIEVLEVSYYLDADLTIPLFKSDKVGVGESVYSKVVFSEPVPVVVANDSSARPVIYHSDDVPYPDESGDRLFANTQYHIKPHDAVLQSGEAKPYQGSNTTFICRYVVLTEDAGGFFFTFINPDINLLLGATFFPDDVAFVYRVRRDEQVDTQTITQWNAQDFTGVVCTPDRHEKHTPLVAVPVPSATVTITAGKHSGEHVRTDGNGRYLFKDIWENELRLRVEKEYFEPKEVVVHRHRATTLLDGTETNPFDGIQSSPGGVLIGYAWPDEVRFIFEEVVVSPDLLYVNDRFTVGRYQYSNRKHGLCIVSTELYAGSYNLILSIIAHEIAHAHQHALATLNGVRDWENTPEGRAYIEALNKDLKEFGMVEGDQSPTHGISVPDENAAEISSWYWSIGKWRDGNSEAWTRILLKEIFPKIPNRLAWAKEWLNKKY